MDTKRNSNFSERERRKYPRIDLIFKVEYELLKNMSNNKMEVSSGKGKDISLGGISFECNKSTDLKNGDMVLVNLSIPELEGNLNAMGRIIRVWEEEGKTFCALKFTTIDPVDYEILNRMIQENLK